MWRVKNGIKENLVGADVGAYVGIAVGDKSAILTDVPVACARPVAPFAVAFAFNTVKNVPDDTAVDKAVTSVEVEMRLLVSTKV